MDRTYARQGWIIALTLAVLAAGLHTAFSPFGFNPTDEGFVLAYSRRALDGQVPHRDFISIRPAGSAYLHVAEVALGGDHTLLASRATIWLQFALIAWLWTMMALSPAGAGCCPLPAPVPGRVMAVLRSLAAAALSALVLALTSNLFPLMPWHTVDGLLLWAVASFCLFHGGPRARSLGLVAAGAAVLCKQSFLPLALATPLIWGGAREVRTWVLVLGPIVLYAVAITIAGGATDGIAQLFAQQGFAAVAVLTYLVSIRFWEGAGLGLAAVGLAWLSGRSVDERIAQLGKGAVGVVITGVLAVVAGSVGKPDFGAREAHLLFGFGIVLLLAPGIERRGLGAALAGAWCAAISIGRATPDLGSGAILAMLARYGGTMLPPMPRAAAAGAIVTVLFAVTALAQVSAGRASHVYRDRPRAELHHDLGAVFAGGSGIRTSARTLEVMADLHDWSTKLQGRRFAIVPDFPVWWTTSPEPNPLPIDWPQDTELATPALLARVTEALDSQRGHITVLVERREVRLLARRPPPPMLGHYAVVAHVRNRWRPVGESEYFIAYE